MTYPLPATRPSATGAGIDITPTGARLICDQLKLAIDAGRACLRGLSDADHRDARGHLRNLLDLLDALETRHGNA